MTRAWLYLVLPLALASACGRLHYDLLPVSGDDAAAPNDAFVGATTFAGTGLDGFTDGPRLQATLFHPFDTLVTAAGIYVADADNNAIRLITPAGDVQTLFGRAGMGFMDGDGAVARLNHPVALALDASGRVLVADERNHAIRRIEGATLTTIAGTGALGAKDGPAREAQFNEPRALLVEPSGAVLIADKMNGTLRRLGEGGVVTTVCGQAGDRQVVDGACGAEARLAFPVGIARDGEGAVWIAEWDMHVVRRLGADGRVAIFAGAVGQRGYADGRGADARVSHPVAPVYDAQRGMLWFFDHGGGQRLRGIVLQSGEVITVFGPRSTDWVEVGFADGADPRFAYPEGVDLGTDGCLYVADVGNGRIRRVCPP